MTIELADPGLYDRDFYLWTQQQAAELRRAAVQRVNLPLDFENLAEEVESLGESDRRAVASHLATIIEHLLKLACPTSRQPRASWEKSVRRARRDLHEILEDSPSLRVSLPEVLGKAYRWGAEDAVSGLRRHREPVADIPETCPFSIEQLLDPAFWPEQPRES